MTKPIYAALLDHHGLDPHIALFSDRDAAIAYAREFMTSLVKPGSGEPLDETDCDDFFSIQRQWQSDVAYVLVAENLLAGDDERTGDAK